MSHNNSMDTAAVSGIHSSLPQGTLLLASPPSCTGSHRRCTVTIPHKLITIKTHLTYFMMILKNIRRRRRRRRRRSHLYLWSSGSVPPEGSGSGVAVGAAASEKKRVRSSQVRWWWWCLLGFGRLSDDVPTEARGGGTAARWALDRCWSSSAVASRGRAEREGAVDHWGVVCRCCSFLHWWGGEEDGEWGAVAAATLQHACDRSH